MSDVFHDALQPDSDDGIHGIRAADVANHAARLALALDGTLDVSKVVRQLDTGAHWLFLGTDASDDDNWYDLTPVLAAVALSNDYNDLDNLPTLGNSASRNVGTGSGNVAAGDAPAAAVTPARVVTALASAASDIAINSHKITGAAAGTSSNDVVIFSQLWPGINAQTTNYQPALTDKGKVIPANLAADGTVTIAPNATVTFAAGDWFEVMRPSSGKRVRIARGTGVAFDGPGTYWLQPGGSCRCTYLGSDNWRVEGVGLYSLAGLGYPFSVATGSVVTQNAAGGFALTTAGGVLTFFVWSPPQTANANNILGAKGNATTQGWQIQNLSGWVGRFGTGSTVVNSPAATFPTTQANWSKIHALSFVLDASSNLVRTVVNGAQVGSGTAFTASTYTASAAAMSLCPQGGPGLHGIVAATFATGSYSLSDIQAMEAAFKADRYAPAYGAGYSNQKVYNPHIADFFPSIAEDVGGAANDQIIVSSANRPVRENYQPLFAF